MTPEQFAYWLQGFSEIGDTGPTKEQWQIIQDHLALVFTKLTPTYKPMEPWFPLPQQSPIPQNHFWNRSIDIYC